MPDGSQNGGCLESWANVKTALPSRRELNLALQMCPKGRAKSDGNLEHVGKELPKHSRRSHGGLKDAWRSLERPEDLGPGAHPSALDLASWLYKNNILTLKTSLPEKAVSRKSFASYRCDRQSILGQIFKKKSYLLDPRSP